MKQAKPKGASMWAVFAAGKSLMLWGTVRKTQAEAIQAATEDEDEWRKLRSYGYTVRKVTVTEGWE